MNLKLRKFREEAHLTQKQFSREIKKAVGTIQSWEAGDSYPNAEAIWNMCEYFGTDPNTFLGWYDEHPNDRSLELSKDEALLIRNYRECTPSRRSKASDAVRDQRDLSKESEFASQLRETGAA